MRAKMLSLVAAVVTLAACSITPTAPTDTRGPNFYIEALPDSQHPVFDWISDTLRVGEQIQFQAYRWEQPPKPPGCFFNCPGSFKVYIPTGSVGWSTSDAHIITVDIPGHVRAISAGNAWVYARASMSDTASFAVVVVGATR